MEQIRDIRPKNGTMLDLNLIRTFVTVCEEGSVTEAAKKLRQPKSTVSRHLGRLEEETQSDLLKRGQTGVSLTPAGKRLFEQARSSIHMLEPIGQSLGAGASGHVCIQVPRYLASGPMTKVLRDFLKQYPEVTLECLSETRLSALASERVDVLVRVETRLGSDGDEWHLGDLCAGLYASPEYLEKHARIQNPEALEAHQILSSCGTSGVPNRIKLSMSKNQSSIVAAKTRLATNEMSVLLAAARDGLGIAELPIFIGQQDVEDGRLQHVLPNYWTDSFSVSIGLTRRSRNPAAQRLIDFVVARKDSLMRN